MVQCVGCAWIVGFVSRIYGGSWKMGIRKDPIELACCDKSADARGKGKSASRCRTIFGAIIALPVLAGDDSSFAGAH